MSSNIYVHLENYFQEYGTLPNYPVIQRYKWNLCSANKQAPAPGRQVISISLLSVWETRRDENEQEISQGITVSQSKLRPF